MISHPLRLHTAHVTNAHILQVMEPDFYQYLSERPMGDGLFYAYRWLLVSFKRGKSHHTIQRLNEFTSTGVFLFLPPLLHLFFLLQRLATAVCSDCGRLFGQHAPRTSQETLKSSSLWRSCSNSSEQ